MMEYNPGDIANGHVLGTDNAWHPLAIVLPQAPSLGYWVRYRKRWRKTYLVLAVFASLSFLASPAATIRNGSSANVLAFLINLFFAAAVSAAFYAVFVNLLVAIPDTGKSQNAGRGLEERTKPEKGRAEVSTREASALDAESINGDPITQWFDPSPVFVPMSAVRTMKTEPGDDAAADRAARVATDRAARAAQIGDHDNPVSS